MSILLPELMFMIFDRLDIDDIILNCKLVNRAWKSLVDNYKFKKLIILNPKVYLDICWVSSKKYKLIEFDRTSFTWNLDLLLNSKAFGKNFNCLKFLKINYPFTDPSILNSLNQCIKLEQLDISFINSPKHSIDNDAFLKLPNLRRLKLDMAFHFSNTEIVIDAAKLEELFCDNLNQIELIHSSSIKFAKLNSYEESINNLTNLEQLFCSEIKNLSKLDLNRLTNLKKIAYIGCELFFKFKKEHVVLIDKLLNQIKFLKRNDLKFCVLGLELSANKSLESYPNFNLHPLLFESRTGYKVIGGDGASHWKTEVNFSDLVNVYGQIPDDYLTRFVNIQSINSSSIHDERAFVKFIKNCPNLNVLVLSSPSLSPQFYQDLPEITSAFTQFIIYENDNIKINYDFILRFKMLYNFITSHDLSISFVVNVIRNLKILENVQFKHDKYSIMIRKLDNNLYDIKCSTNNSINFHKYNLKLDSLIARLFKVDKKVSKRRKL